MIHVFGDSHSGSFHSCKGYIVHTIGRCTAHNLICPSSSTQGKAKIDAILKTLPVDSKALFVFGEIDCRIHIYNKHMVDGAKYPLRHYIHWTVERYGQFLHYIKQCYPVQVSVMAVPPANYEANEFHYPYYAPPHKRTYIYKTFNETLKRKCVNLDLPFIDVNSHVTLSNGFTDRRYMRDDVHLSHRAIPLVTAELQRLGCLP